MSPFAADDSHDGGVAPPREPPLGDVPPRERLLFAGASALSEVELVALLLGTGRRGEGVVQLARRLLAEAGDLRLLAEAHPRELMTIHGLGAAKAARVSAALELGRRLLSSPWRPGEAFTSSQQVYAHYHPLLRAEKREIFFAVYLDARNRLIGEREISSGSLVGSLVHPREVFRPAIQMAAAAVICVHNHPSGDPSHSTEDVAITRRLHEAGNTIGILLLDHVIIGDGSYCSFVDRGVPPFDTEPPSAADRSRLGGALSGRRR